MLKFWSTEKARKVPFQRYWLRDPFTFKEVYFIRWSLTKSSFRFNLLLDSPCSVCGLTYLLFALSKITCMIESGIKPHYSWWKSRVYRVYLYVHFYHIDLLTYWPIRLWCLGDLRKASVVPFFGIGLPTIFTLYMLFVCHIDPSSIFVHFLSWFRIFLCRLQQITVRKTLSINFLTYKVTKFTNILYSF